MRHCLLLVAIIVFLTSITNEAKLQTFAWWCISHFKLKVSPAAHDGIKLPSIAKYRKHKCQLKHMYYTYFLCCYSAVYFKMKSKWVVRYTTCAFEWTSSSLGLMYQTLYDVSYMDWYTRCLFLAYILIYLLLEPIVDSWKVDWWFICYHPETYDICLLD